MERKSSIHIEQGNLGFLFHNDRSKPTANSIFSQEKNEYSCSAKEALEIYREELQKRSEAYTQRTGKKLHKNTITHLSAIVNLDEQHTLEDVKKIAEYLEQELDTKVFQIAVHRDEGYVEEDGTPHINYHAHLEMLGLDKQGNSIRRKLDRKFLINLQDKVAEILQMERGVNYTAERKKRPKRLDTYEYKEHARRQAEKEKELLAKVKDLKEENRRLREELKEAGAQREQYAQLEAFVKQLKEQIKSKDLTITQLKEKMQQKEKELLKQIYSPYKMKSGGQATWEDVAKHYITEFKELKPKFDNYKKKKEAELERLKKEKLEEEKRREKAEKEAKELQNKVYSDYKILGERISWQELAQMYKEKTEQVEEEARKLREMLRNENEKLLSRGRINPRYVEKIERENKTLKEENGLLKEAMLQIAKELNIHKPDNLLKNLKEGIKRIVDRVRNAILSKYTLEIKNDRLEEEIRELKEQNSWKM